MFTGIVEELGQVKALSLRGNSGTLTVKAKKVLEGTKIGDSIAVNGVCLTVTNMKNNEFSADVMAETVRRSSLGALQDGSYVNLERAMAADGRFGGHIVSGHIDVTGQIESMRREENAVWVTIACADKILDLIVEKGSICIDGISLTVAAVTKRNFSVSVIPHTGEETTLLKKKAGDPVNLKTTLWGNIFRNLWISEEIPVRTGEKCLTMKMPRETQRETQGSAWSFFRNMDFKTDALKIFRNIQKI